MLLSQNSGISNAKSQIDVADQKARINHFFTAPQDEEEKELERQLCQDKGAGEWFRLESGEKKCRDVIQCTVSVRKNCQFSTNQKYHFVAVISFPSVLVFQLNDDH